MRVLAWASMLLLVQGGLLAQRALTLSWQELAPEVQDRWISTALADGSAVEGRVVDVEADALLVKGKKGVVSIPRASLKSLSVGPKKSSKRTALGAAIGGGAGAVPGVLAYQYANNEANRSLGGSLLAGFIGGAAALGALIGWASDREASRKPAVVIHIKPN
ncbi:MAG: hypothetical protein FJW20_20905 [Acidimicrobiia bacterium]|nr:hypothetical protein [Acidimicrobiia bacterium]